MVTLKITNGQNSLIGAGDSIEATLYSTEYGFVERQDGRGCYRRVDGIAEFKGKDGKNYSMVIKCNIGTSDYTPNDTPSNEDLIGESIRLIKGNVMLALKEGRYELDLVSADDVNRGRALKYHIKEDYLELKIKRVRKAVL